MIHLNRNCSKSHRTTYWAIAIGFRSYKLSEHRNIMVKLFVGVIDHDDLILWYIIQQAHGSLFEDSEQSW